MDWRSLITPFAKPIGAIINKALSAAAAAFIGYAIKAGWPLTEVTALSSMAVLAVSTVISGLAATQGIQIPVINQDESNGVKVVSSDAVAPAVNVGK